MKTGKNEALTYSEMEEMNVQLAKDNHLYMGDGVSRREAISGIVGTIAQDVAKEREKVDLRDTKQVKLIAQRYLEACSNTGVLPSKSGLARSLGYSRAGLWLFVKDNPDHRTTELLNILFDAFLEAMDLAASSGSVHAIYSIWIEKSQYDMRDNTPIQPPKGSGPLGPHKTEEELREIFEKYIVIDEEVNTGDESPL